MLANIDILKSTQSKASVHMTGSNMTQIYNAKQIDVNN